MDESVRPRNSRSGSDTRQRGRRITFRLTEAENAAVELAAERAGLTVASYARERVVDAPQTRSRRRPSVEVESLAKAVAQLGRVGGNLHQIAKHLNFGEIEHAADLPAALQEFREVVAMLMAAAGKDSPMIISGGARSNWRFFAKHLMKTEENERVEVTEIRGLAAENVQEAFREMHFVASGTQAKNFFYHANINPREGETLTPQQWEQAIDTLEHELGLNGQARFVVQHEKEGRIHCHVVWSRIDPDSMTAISDSKNYEKHELAARELEREFGHEAVQGVHVDRDGERPERRPKNWETFRGHGSDIDPQQLKAELTELWRHADSGKAFAAALDERGYILCKGDRRDFVIVDSAGDEHSLARRLQGVKAAEIRERMADLDRDGLPSVAQGRALAQAREPDDRDEGGTGPGQASPQTAEPKKDTKTDLQRVADSMLHSMEAAPAATSWTDADIATAWAATSTRTLSVREQLAAFAAPYIAEIRDYGSILMRDGLAVWERVSLALGQVRDAASAWLRDHTQSFVDSATRTREDGPDAGERER